MIQPCFKAWLEQSYNEVMKVTSNFYAVSGIAEALVIAIHSAGSCGWRIPGLPMHVSELLSPLDVSFGFRAANKLTLLHGLAELISRSSLVPSDVIASGLVQRERLGGTGTGNGVALPHARLPEIQKMSAHFARLETPIDYASVDDRPVDLVFMLLLPGGNEGNSLPALACVARKLKDAATLASLRRASSASGLYSTLIA